MDAVKLSHFEPTVGLNTISGGVNPVTDTRAYGAETGGLKALQGAVGVALKMKEDSMMADVTKALTEYRKQVDNLTYNPENGLFHLENENAKDLTQKYQTGESEIRRNILKTLPNYKAARDAFEKNVEQLNMRTTELYQKKEYQEAEKYKDATVNDFIEQAQISMQRGYQTTGVVGDRLDDIRKTIYANYASTKGLQWCKDKAEEVAGKSIQQAMAQASADDSQEGLENLINNYSPLVNPQYIRNFIAANNQQKKQAYINDEGKKLFSQFGNDMAGARKFIATMDLEEPSTGNFGLMAVAEMAKQEGYPSYLDEIGGTTCAHWATTAVHKVDPSFPVIDNVDVLVDTAREKGIYHKEDGYQGRPGDLVVIDYPNEKQGHTFMIGNDGTVWNAGGATPLYNQKATPEEFARICGGTISGIVSISSISGGGVGPARKRKLTPAEQDKVFAAYQKERGIAESIKNQQRRTVMEALQNQAAEMAANGVYDENAYIHLADSYKGTDMYADAVRAVSGWAGHGASIAGVSRRGHSSGGGSSANDAYAAFIEQMQDGSMNETEVRAMLTASDVSPDSALGKKVLATNRYILSGGSNVINQLKLKWENSGHNTGDFNKALPYLMNYISGEKEAGKKPSFEDMWTALLDGEQPVTYRTSSGAKMLKKNQIFNSTGGYSWNPDTGEMWQEGHDLPTYFTGDDMDEFAGGIDVEEED